MSNDKLKNPYTRIDGLPRISDTATGNSNAIVEKATICSKNCKKKDEKAYLSFETNLSSMNLSLNVSFQKLFPLLRSIEEHLKNPHQFHQQNAELVKRALKEYYLPRISFEGSFDGGFSFHYLAMNTGNTGLISFGDYCLIVSNEQAINWDDSAFLIQNSLLKSEDSACGFHYFEADFELDRKKLSQDLAVYALGKQLALVKHAETLQSGDFDEKKLAKLICDPEKIDYIEFITTTQVKARHIMEIRLSERLTTLLFELTMLSYEDSRVDISLVVQHNEILAAADKLGIKVYEPKN